MYKKIIFRLLGFFFLLFGQLKVLSQQNFSFIHKLPNGLQINVTGVINNYGNHPNLDILVDAIGTSNSNARLYWDVNYEYNQTIQNTTVEFFIRKGRVEINKLKIKNIPSVNKIRGFKKEPFYEQISVPAIMSVSGEKNIKENERANLTVNYTGDATDYIWKWYEIQGPHKDVLLTTGESVTLPSFYPGKRSCYVVGVHNKYGFTTENLRFNVDVSELWTPTKDEFSISANKTSIIESESVEITVNSRYNTPSLNWSWYETINGKSKQLEFSGNRIIVSPSSDASYKVRAMVHYENKDKPSDFSEPLSIRVRRLQPPPKIASISPDINLTQPIRDTQAVVLSLTMEDDLTPGQDVSFEWMNKNTQQIIPSRGNSIKVRPSETTTYMVRTVRTIGPYRKTTGWKEFTINVNPTSKAPEIFSDTIFCGKSTDQLRIRFRKGRLGNGSQKWNLYSGAFGYGGNLLQSVTDDKSFTIPFPPKTTMYYIAPENDPRVYKQFTITIIEKPDYIADQPIANQSNPCKGAWVRLEVNMDKKPSGSEFTWYQITTSGTRKTLQKNKDVLYIEPEDNVKYCVNITNNACGINKTQCREFKINDYTKFSSRDVSPIDYEKSGISIEIPSYIDAQGATWKWYPNGKEETSVSGNRFSTKNKKIKTVSLRAEGPCGIQDISTYKIDWKKTRHLFYFINAGIITQDFSQFNNFYFTIGTESVFIRAKNNIDLLTRAVSAYQCNNQKILNYPVNSNTYYTFTDNALNKRASYLLGFMTRGDKVKLFLGSGYGERKLFWEANIYQYYTNILRQTSLIKNIEQSYSGMEGEAGLFFDFNNFNIMTGINILHDSQKNKTYFDIQAGIGFSTKRK